MLVRTPADLGAVLRDRRKHLDLDQATVAKRIGVSRQWVMEIERGHPRAELALVLRAIDVLGLRLDAAVGPASDHPPSDGVHIDAIVARARQAKP